MDNDLTLMPNPDTAWQVKHLCLMSIQVKAALRNLRMYPKQELKKAHKCGMSHGPKLINSYV